MKPLSGHIDAGSCRRDSAGERRLFRRLSLLFGGALAVANTLFWGWGYVGHLAMLEETNRFLFERGFALRILSEPAGLSAWTGALLTQLFHWKVVGALLLTATLLSAAGLLQGLFRRAGIAFRFLPLLWAAILLFAFLQVSDLFRLQVALQLLFFYLFARVYREAFRGKEWLYLALAPLFFGTMGTVPSLLLYPTCALSGGALPGRFRNRLLFAAAGMGLALLCPFVWERLGAAIPEGRLFFFFPEGFDAGLRNRVAALYLLPALLSLAARIPAARRSGRRPWAVFGWLLIPAGGIGYAVFCPYAGLFRASEIEYRADRAALEGHWDQVLALVAEEPQPSRRLLFRAGMALAQRGELPDRLFRFPLPDDLVLAPPSGRDYPSQTAAAEFYYRLGFSGEALHRYAEAAVGGFDFRILKRMALLTAERGETALADRYLRLLERTLCYRGFAARERARMEESKPVERREAGDRSFVGGRPFAAELENLLRIDPENRTVRDYLLCTFLVQKRFDDFCRVYAATPGTVAGTPIPRAYEEALLVAAQLGYPVGRAAFPHVSEAAKADFIAFFTVLNRGGSRPEQVRAALSKYRFTWWYYNQFLHPLRLSEQQETGPVSATS